MFNQILIHVLANMSTCVSGLFTSIHGHLMQKKNGVPCWYLFHHIYQQCCVWKERLDQESIFNFGGKNKAVTRITFISGFLFMSFYRVQSFMTEATACHLNWLTSS